MFQNKVRERATSDQNKIKCTFWYLAVLCAATCFLQSSSTQASSILTGRSVGLPCQSTGTQTSTCDLGLSSCQQVQSELKAQLSSYIETKEKFAYSHQINVNVSKTTDPSQPKGTPLGSRVCRLTQGEVRSQNRNPGQSCGNTIGIAVSGNTVHVIAGRDGYGEREVSWQTGALVDSMKCFEQQLMNEIERGEIQVSYACEALAEDLRKLTHSTALTSQTFLNSLPGGVDNFCNQATLSDSGKKVKDFCREESGIQLDSDIERHRVVACELKATERELVSAYGYFLRCELNARAASAHANVFAGSAGGIEAQIQANIGEPCKREVQRKLERNCRTRSCARRNVPRWGRECYERRVEPFFKNLIETNFPTNGACRA